MNLCPQCAKDDAGWRDAPMDVVNGGIRWLDNGSQNTVLAAHLGQQQEAVAGEAYPGELNDLRQQLERAHALVRKLNREALDAEFAVHRVNALANELHGEAEKLQATAGRTNCLLGQRVANAAARLRTALGADL